MSVKIVIGDALEQLRLLTGDSVHCCVTSPPYYGLRDYGIAGQIGLEPSPDEYVAALVGVFREVRRVLRRDGTLWLNMGDSYASDPPGRTSGDPMAKSGLAGMRTARVARDVHLGEKARQFGEGVKRKDLLGIPWMLAFALRADGWWLRQDIIWSKPNPMPESVTDRCTKAHEYLFLLSRSERYWFDAAAIAEPAIGPPGGNVKPLKSFEHDPIKHRTKGGIPAAQQRARENGGYENRNKRSVWTVATNPYAEAHFATFPPALVEPCILAGCPKGGAVLDPFAGAGTTGLVADRLGRDAVLIELNPLYAAMAERRIRHDGPLFADIDLSLSKEARTAMPLL